MYFFIPKVLLKDQKMLNFRRIENYLRRPFNLCASLNAFTKTDACKNGKICIKACLEIEKTQAVCCSHSQNILFSLK